MSAARAQRRRELRAAGSRRSQRKRGRRAPIRASASSTSHEATRSEVVIARSNIAMPTPEEIAAVLDPDALQRVLRG
jgi:hypothetical protein